MSQQPLIFVNALILSDEAVTEMRSFLYALISAYESKYANQLRRYQWECYQRRKEQSDLFDDIEDDLGASCKTPKYVIQANTVKYRINHKQIEKMDSG